MSFQCFDPADLKEKEKKKAQCGLSCIVRAPCG